MKTLILVTAVLMLPTFAFANGTHFTNFKKTYPDYKSPNCKICHSTGKQLNPYGLDFANHNLNFQEIEPLDSDGDTFVNLDEIKASMNPGDKEAHPTLVQ